MLFAQSIYEDDERVINFRSVRVATSNTWIIRQFHAIFKLHQNQRVFDQTGRFIQIAAGYVYKARNKKFDKLNYFRFQRF